ncbi:MAG: YgfZ/GcvT domain-containing protein [Arenimonas sp.]
MLEGPDAVAFIQAQSMNDVKALTDGQWHWNGLLNPKGRLIALFALVRIHAGLLYLLLPDFPAEKLAVHLQRFVFRSKVKLVLDKDSVFASEFDISATSPATRDHVSGDIDSGLSLDFSSDAVSRRLWLFKSQSIANIDADDGKQANWRDTDIMHGLPRLAENQTEHWTPQMLSLDRLNAFSLKKGCYPGQEIVARTHYLGQAKRQTYLVEAGRLEVGGTVLRDQEKVGEIICVTSKNATGLALLQSVSDSDSLASDKHPIHLLQALTGLQRSN